MINREHFVSDRNYYLISILHFLLWPIYTLSRIFSNRKQRNNKILFVELGHMGDMLTTASVIKLVKEKKPNSEIICLCSASGAAALKNNPFVDEVVVLKTPFWYMTTAKTKSESFITSFRGYLRALRKVDADTVVNIRTASYHVDHIAAWLAGSRVRVGFGNKGLGYLLSYAGNAPNEVPNPIQKLNLVNGWLGLPMQSQVMRPTFFPSPESPVRVKQLLTELGLNDDEIIIGVNPGAQHNFLWPEKNYVTLCKLIRERIGAKILFLGTPAHEAMINRIREQLPFNTYSAAGKTNLDDLFVLLKRLALLVTVDTGIRHMANAADVPVVAMRFGADGYERYGKYSALEAVVINRVSCAPCGKEECPLPEMICMTRIEPEKVMESIVVQLENSGMAAGRSVDASGQGMPANRE